MPLWQRFHQELKSRKRRCKQHHRLRTHWLSTHYFSSSPWWLPDSQRWQQPLRKWHQIPGIVVARNPADDIIIEIVAAVDLATRTVFVGTTCVSRIKQNAETSLVPTFREMDRAGADGGQRPLSLVPPPLRSGCSYKNTIVPWKHP